MWPIVCLWLATPSAAAQKSRDSPSSRLARLLAIDSGSPLPPPIYSSRLNDIAVEFMLKGDLPQAIELLSQAVARDPGNGVALANLTLAYLRHGDLEFAEFYLQQAVAVSRRASPDPRIYSILGDIYESRNRLFDAVTAWQEARRLGDTNPELLEKINRIQKERAYARGQKFLDTTGFQFFYDPAISDAAVRETAAFLDQDNDDLSSFFMHRLAARPVVILYSGHSYFSLMDTPDWVAGYYDGRIHLPVPPEGTESSEFRSLLRHELAHAFLNEISAGRAPRWLQEGLAQFVEGRRITPAEAAADTPLGGNLSLQGIDQSFLGEARRDQARRAYELSLSFVEYLAEARGAGAVVCLAHDLGRGESPASAIEEQFGESAQTLTASWQGVLTAAHPEKRAAVLR